MEEKVTWLMKKQKELHFVQENKYRRGLIIEVAYSIRRKVNCETHLIFSINFLSPEQLVLRSFRLSTSTYAVEYMKLHWRSNDILVREKSGNIMILM